MKLAVKTPRRWLAWGLVAVILLSVTAWYATLDRLPAEIRIATGAKGGLYCKLAEVLAAELQVRTGHPVKVIETLGSEQNKQLLDSGEADLALSQSGSVAFDELAVLAPLYQKPRIPIS